jgi:hypothetical protein
VIRDEVKCAELCIAGCRRIRHGARRASLTRFRPCPLLFAVPLLRCHPPHS